jgi:pullulanase-type alpha-1,6-glucosidase
MLKAREAVQAVDSDTYFYGEGWNFGEVANNQQFTQASQLELGGTQIGTFTDRLRDAVRGGAFSASGDDIRKSQGIGSGLGTLPNELVNKEESRNSYLLSADQLRIGLAGNLADFPLKNAQNKNVTGKDIPYGDQPTGYALDPADTINYVSKHDNQTLWDNNQYRLPYATSTKDRVRIHLQSLSFPIFAQGIPFLHMGSEFLRSKAFLRDSYDYGDWFNKVDFTKQTNNYNVGLPPADKDQANWPLIKKLLAKNEGRDMVSPSDIAFSAEVFKEFISLRMSTPLFRLTSSEEIIKRVKFHNTGEEQQIGLIVMSIDDSDKYQQLDADISGVVVIFNTSSTSKTFHFKGAEQYQLHPIQQNGIDTIVKESNSYENSFSVLPFTTSVFIKK